MFLQLDGTLWVQLANFVIFFAILNVVFLRPVGEAVRERRAYIESVLVDNERYVRESKALRSDVEAKRAQARREAADYFAAARAEAAAESAAIMSEHIFIADSIIKQTHATIAGETEAAYMHEPALADGLAKALLQRAVGILNR
jgi:F0F1-type ATP synthase membrane subunit b/b'